MLAGKTKLKFVLFGVVSPLQFFKTICHGVLLATSQPHPVQDAPNPNQVDMSQSGPKN